LMQIKILYEDNHLLGVEKPANVPVQEDASKDGDLLSFLKQYIQRKYNKKGEAFLGMVHRLDRPAGGAMVFARTSKAASRLSEQMRARKVQKTYLAVVEGSYADSAGTYHSYLFKDRTKNIVHVVPKGTPGSQEALLNYHVVARAEGMSLVKIDLETGRPHQIRVQFSHDGHPLIGDNKYGSTRHGKPTKHLALWSLQLDFKHPVRDEVIRIVSNPPNEHPWVFFSTDIISLLNGGEL
jgi:23S rRNA pseudouridine1911/1915/1917 synthase